MVSGDNNNMQDIFMCSTSGGAVRRISQSGRTEGNGDSPIAQGDRIGISYSGTWITYNTNADNLGVLKGNIVLQHTGTGTIIPITDTKGGSTGSPRVSREGAYVIAGCSEKYDTRFPSSGIFVFFPPR
jgi:Tol biopolymer transport system component